MNNIDSFITTLDNYMIENSTSVAIVTEAFNIKEKINKIWEAFKNFFKNLIAKIQGLLNLNPSKSVYVYKDSYNKLKSLAFKESVMYSEFINDAVSEIKDTMHTLQSSRHENSSSTALLPKGIRNLSQDIRDKYAKGKYSKELEIFLNNFKIDQLKTETVKLEKSDIADMMKLINSFEKEGTKFHQFTQSLHLSEEEFNALFPTYQFILQCGINLTQTFMRAFNEIRKVRKTADATV